MAKRDMQKAIDAIGAIEPRTKAAQLRSLIPEIERKLEEGAQLAAIHEALVQSGIDLSFQTLKTYLYRHRKRMKGAADISRQTLTASPETADAPQIAEPQQAGEGLVPNRPKSVQDLDRLMRPDPVAQAQELAHYERLARNQKRSRT